MTARKRKVKARVMSQKLYDEVVNALIAASRDIHESLQLFVMNHSGKARDGFFYGKPKIPLTAHADGIKASERVEAQLGVLITKLWKNYPKMWKNCHKPRTAAKSAQKGSP